MTKLNQIYKCNICGNIVEVVHNGVGQLVCCGKPMEKMEAKTEDQGKEKHLPIIKKDKKEYQIKVGEIPHPMEKDHYIEWIEIAGEQGSCKKFLKAEDSPEAKFAADELKIKARIFCNIHGLWKNK